MNPADLKVSSVFELPKRKVARKKSAVWAEFFAARKTGDLIEAATRTEAKLICYHARQNGFHPAMRPIETGWSVFLRGRQEAPEAPVQAVETPAPAPAPEAPTPDVTPDVTPKVWLPLSMRPSRSASDEMAKKYAEDAYNIYHQSVQSLPSFQPWKVVMNMKSYEFQRTRWLNIGAYIAAMVQGGAK